ncbi:MAG TPA: murein L,D-transpeptidase catalytic domain family protein [Steroidobacteraceae bacterium]|nr:murein L,D-transpeptidase catalytic domain family protein [Steroidobacteraceae bacterium]
MTVSRRAFLGATLSGVALAAVHRTHAATAAGARSVPPQLLERALGALQRHGERIEHRDVIGIADFSLPSSSPRFYLLNLADGSVSSHLVAHGRGSDPTHTGWLQRFSNEPHSNATSAGAYRTGALYVGGHGPALHLDGLDPTNSNAAARAIVVHGAWYVSPHLLDTFGRLGRSQGCFAVGDASLAELLAKLGPGRLIYADKV